MKKAILIVISLWMAHHTRGQHMPTLSTYTYNLMTINPAYAGYKQDLDIAMAFTRAVPFVEGGSQFGNISVNGPVGVKNIGVGGMIASDRLGVYSQTEVTVATSYKLFSRNRNSYTSWGFYPKVLSFGIQAGLNHIREDLTSVGAYHDPEYESDINQFVPSIGMGVFYSEKNFYLGLSAPRLMGSVFSSDEQVALQNHVYLQSGFNGSMGKNYFIKPGLLMRYVPGSPIQLDANVVFQYLDKIEWGIGYRSVAGINFLFGIHVTKECFVVYHFDTSFDQNDNPWSNLHGLMIKYNPFRAY